MLVANGSINAAMHVFMVITQGYKTCHNTKYVNNACVFFNAKQEPIDH